MWCGARNQKKSGRTLFMWAFIWIYATFKGQSDTIFLIIKGKFSGQVKSSLQNYLNQLRFFHWTTGTAFFRCQHRSVCLRPKVEAGGWMDGWSVAVGRAKERGGPTEAEAATSFQSHFKVPLMGKTHSWSANILNINFRLLSGFPHTFFRAVNLFLKLFPVPK